MEDKMSTVNEMVETKQNVSWDEALEKETWVAPLVDIYETTDDYFLTALMPGVSKENVKIKFEEQTLVIMGRINFNESLQRKYVLKETEIGNYYRRFNISDSVDESKIDAKLNDGVLTIRLPKHERVKPRTIEIK